MQNFGPLAQLSSCPVFASVPLEVGSLSPGTRVGVFYITSPPIYIQSMASFAFVVPMVGIIYQDTEASSTISSS